MLTRIEISGFKTFDDFSLDLDPFTVIAGANAAGKSNLFDAIRLLSRLAGGDLRSAFTGLRGEPQELFRRDHALAYANAWTWPSRSCWTPWCATRGGSSRS